jgi:hypothetical protein
MKKIFFIGVLLIAGYFGWQKLSHGAHDKLEPLYEKPYVVVYGRDRCGLTKKCLKNLKNKEIEVVYETIDRREVVEELHPRMEEAGLSTRNYGLPVVDVNGHMFIRPDIATIIEAYNNYQ